MTPLRQRMIREMELRQFTPRTIEAYVGAVAGLANFYHRSPEHLQLEEVRSYLHHLLTERRLAQGTCNLQQRVLLMTTYAAGLRLKEVTHLKPIHIHSERLCIRVEQGKGQKDRYTLLSPQLLEELRRYWREYRPGEWLFPNKAGTGAMLRGTAQKIFYAAKRRAGLERGHGIHTLRHASPRTCSKRASICAPFNCSSATRASSPPRSICTSPARGSAKCRAPSTCCVCPQPRMTCCKRRKRPCPSLAVTARPGHGRQTREARGTPANWRTSSVAMVRLTKCQAFAKAQWLEARRAELLPVPYFHNVFTLPHEFNPLILCHERNQRALLGLLFHAAAETLLAFARNNLGGALGVTMVLHTWDQQLRAHFHVHCLIPGGALSHDRTRWLPAKRKFLFPVRALSKVFRGKFLDGLRQLHVTGKLVFPAAAASCCTSCPRTSRASATTACLPAEARTISCRAAGNCSALRNPSR